MNPKIKITQTVISFNLIATKMVFAYQEFFKKKNFFFCQKWFELP